MSGAKKLRELTRQDVEWMLAVGKLLDRIEELEVENAWLRTRLASKGFFLSRGARKGAERN